MTTGGWIFMLISWGVILSLMMFTYVRTITCKPQAEDDK